jgi:acetyl esterase/lipase
MEYRRVGEKGGGWPGTFLDAAKGADFARTIAQEYPIDLKRVVVIGHSAGGLLALWLAARHRLRAQDLLDSKPLISLRGVVAVSAVTDLLLSAEKGLGDGFQDRAQRLMGGTQEEHPDRYALVSPSALLPLGVRQTVIHSMADDTVPFGLASRYVDVAKLSGDHVSLVCVDGAGHFDLIDPLCAVSSNLRNSVVDMVS